MRDLRILQNILIGITLAILSFLPLVVAFGTMSSQSVNLWYFTSFVLVFLVMLIRPLADILAGIKVLHKLVFLRKGVGLLSAAIIISFVIGKIIVPDSQYLKSIFSSSYWSLEGYSLFAHLGDITGFILLIISNNFSMVLLKKNWKRLQKLAYVYFYAGGIYEFGALGSTFALVAMVIVFIAVIIAFVIKIIKKINVTKKSDVYSTYP